MKDRIVEAVGGLLHTGHAEAVSGISERVSASFPIPLRRGMGWNGMLEKHIQDAVG